MSTELSKYVCTFCNLQLPSRNKLFAHIHGRDGSGCSGAVYAGMRQDRLNQRVAMHISYDQVDLSAKDQPLLFAGEVQPGQILKLNSDPVRRALVKSVNKAVADTSPPKSDSSSSLEFNVDDTLIRSSSISSRTSYLLRQDEGVSASSDLITMTLPAYCLAETRGNSYSFLDRVNAHLRVETEPRHFIVAHSCIKLKGGLHAVHDRTQMRYEYVVPVSAFFKEPKIARAIGAVEQISLQKGSWFQFLLATVVRNASKDTGKKVHTLENKSPVRFLRRLNHAKMVNTVHNIYLYLNNIPEHETLLLRRLKKLAKHFTPELGKLGLHNFSIDSPLPNSPVTQRAMGKHYLKGHVIMNGGNFLVFSFSGAAFITGYVRRLIGLLVAIVRSNGHLKDSLIPTLTAQHVLFDLGPLSPPSNFQMLVSASHAYYETKHKQRLAPGMAAKWHNMIVPGLAQGVFNYRARLIDRMTAKWKSESGMRILQSWIASVDAILPKLKQLSLRPSSLAEDIVHKPLSTCPDAYKEVLRLLRQASRSGKWPKSSTARASLIVNLAGETVAQKQNLYAEVKGKEISRIGGRGGKKEERRLKKQEWKKKKQKEKAEWESYQAARKEANKHITKAEGSFSLGSMPQPSLQPRANSIFPELFSAIFRLEKVIAPNRPPSSTVAVNRNAQFRIHRDSGAGSGQLQSMIVGLGDYQGGELMVEDAREDIRYRPLEFDGWKQRHSTLPFQGERFSLVWFTPQGCENETGLKVSQQLIGAQNCE